MSKEWRLGSEDNHLTFPGLIVFVLIFLLFVFAFTRGEGSAGVIDAEVIDGVEITDSAAETYIQ